MPVPIKNPKKPLPPSKKKYTRAQLEKVNREKLKTFCRRKNLPFVRLIKSQLIDNILLWKAGKEIKFPDLVRTWEEMKNAEHRISPQMRKFCLDYATCTKRKTQSDWGREFGVSIPTINLWLAWSEIKDLIEAYRYSIEKRVTELFAQNQETAVAELVALITGRRVAAEVKRKAINDLLGYSGRVNINATKVVMNQKQAQGVQNNYGELSDEQIDEALKEMDELEAG